MKVNHATLVVLALLRTEPMHGHQIRRVSEIVNLSAWAEVSTGAIYNTLRRLAADGEIVALRSEQEGNRPPRTVYALTEAGQYQLRRLREIALSQATLDPAVNIALVFTAPGSDPDELRELLSERRTRLKVQHEDLVHHRERDTRLAGIPITAQLSFRQWELRLAAEISWHDELETQIDALCDPAGILRAPDHTKPVAPAARERGQKPSSIDDKVPPR